MCYIVICKVVVLCYIVTVLSTAACDESRARRRIGKCSQRQPPSQRRGGGRPPRARLAAPTDHCAFASLFSAPPSGWPKLPHPLPGAPASQPRSLGLAAPLHRRDPARATRAAETCTDAPAVPAEGRRRHSGRCAWPASARWCSF